MKKNIFLITGGCGFIGSALIRRLLSDQSNTVINIDKLTYAANIASLETTKDKDYIFYKEDIVNNKFLKKILKKHNPDYVIHLAAESHVDRSIDSPETFIMTNVLGTYYLLNSSYEYWKSLDKNKKNKFKFLLVSTDEVYGSLDEKDDSFTESSSYRPNSPYAATKASSDHLARSWNKTYNFPVIITNTSNNYGNWQFPEKLIPLVISKCLNKEDIPIYGNGQQVRDWIHVDDHVSGILFALLNGKSGSKYNIGSNNELSNISVVKAICGILDNLKPLDTGCYAELIKFVSDRPGHDTRYAINSKKMIDLGWHSNISWEEGIKSTINWYLKNKDFLNSNSTKNHSGKRLGKI